MLEKTALIIHKKEYSGEKHGMKTFCHLNPAKSLKSFSTLNVWKIYAFIKIVRVTLKDYRNKIAYIHISVVKHVAECKPWTTSKAHLIMHLGLAEN